MVPLIKNKIASVEDVAHLPAGRVAKRCTPGCSPASSPSQVIQCSSNLVDSPVSLPSISSPHLSSQAPSATSLTGQTTVASTVPAEPARSPEFSDEESQRESDNFSFHFSQDEEWTDEVEARMQNAIDRMLEDARRQLAEPVLNFSDLFPDDLLADSVAHQTAANPRTSRFGASSSEMDDRTSVKQDDVEVMVEDMGYGIDNVWEELGTYVPARLLSPIPEELLADEFVVEEDAHSPPLSFKHAICFEERQWVADKVRITTKSSTEPPIPPMPPDVYLRQRRRRWKPPDPYLIALRITTTSIHHIEKQNRSEAIMESNTEKQKTFKSRNAILSCDL